MNENDKGRKENKEIASHSCSEETTLPESNSTFSDITGILDERILNLREAIEEIDSALAHRKVLNVCFLEQINREAEEVKRHLNMLQEPWKMGFHPDVEFLRLSFHKSLTSRAKERRGEQLKYWENGVNLAKERRKFLDEYKELLAAKKRLMQT
jgi:hypothetical protein